MKSLFLFCTLFLLAITGYTQIRLNAGLGGNIATTSAFLDASSSTTWNNATQPNNGKGLVFPRVDLSTFVAMQGTAGLSNSFPGRFDGMIVYNSANGTSGIGSTLVTPGFYYYKNSTTNVNGGTWVRMNDSNDASTGATVYYGVLNTTTPTAADVQALANKNLASGSYSGSFDQSLASAGYFTVAIPVSWRNPSLKISGNDTWNVFNAASIVNINNISYQLWQTDVTLPSGESVAVK